MTTQMNEKTIQSFMGTILGTALFATDEEIEKPFQKLEVPQKEEKVLDPITPAEKSLWFTRWTLVENLENFNEAKPKNMKELSEFTEKFEKKHSEIKMLEKLFWRMIKNRIGEADAAEKIGIRKTESGNIVVVSMKLEEDNDDFPFPFPFPGGIAFVKIKG